MSKLGDFVAKHHSGVTKAYTAVGIGLIGLMGYEIAKLNNVDGTLNAYDQINKMIEEEKDKHPEDSEETGA